MVSPAEAGNFQPQPEKGKKLGGLKGKFAMATLFAGGLTAAAAGSVHAGAELYLADGGSTSGYCDNGDYVLETDFTYAAKLLEQLASGELVVAFGPTPIAAAVNEGDQTAVVQPKTITPDEIWANLAKPAPECPVVVVVDPTPTPEATPAPEIKNVNDLIKQSKPSTPRKISGDLENAYATIPELKTLADQGEIPTLQIAKQRLKFCQVDNPNIPGNSPDALESNCRFLLFTYFGLYQQLDNNPKLYDISSELYGYMKKEFSGKVGNGYPKEVDKQLQALFS